MSETAVAVRTKAMKCLSSVVAADPSVLARVGSLLVIAVPSDLPVSGLFWQLRQITHSCLLLNPLLDYCMWNKDPLKVNSVPPPPENIFPKMFLLFCFTMKSFKWYIPLEHMSFLIINNLYSLAKARFLIWFDWMTCRLMFNGLCTVGSWTNRPASERQPWSWSASLYWWNQNSSTATTTCSLREYS